MAGRAGCELLVILFIWAGFTKGIIVCVQVSQCSSYNSELMICCHQVMLINLNTGPFADPI